MNKKVNKLLALSAAFVMSGSLAVALSACSETDDQTEPTALAAPVVKLENNVVSWQAVENATGYSVNVNDAAPVELAADKLSYTLTMTEAGSYTVTVVATSNNASYSNSAPSNSVTYVVTAPTGDPTPLAKPEIEIDGNLVSWGAVQNATGYTVRIGNTSSVDVTGTSYEITFTGAEVGSFEISVIATSTNAAYSNSAASEVVTYTRRLSRLDAASTGSDVPTKRTYFLDEKATALDLTGLALKAVFSDDGEYAIPNTALNVNLPENALSTVGTKQATVSYGEGEAARSKTFEITVKQRTVVDLEAAGVQYDTVMNEYSSTAEKYKIADTEVESAVDMAGNSLQVTHEGGKSYVAATAFAASGSKLLKIRGEGQAFVNVVAAQYITNAEQLQAINDNLAGYYVLQNDISLDGHLVQNNAVKQWWSHKFTPIGTAPVKGTGAENDPVILDFEATEGLTQAGRPFTGTFDGNGHIINDALIHSFTDDVAPWNYAMYYYGLFGYIGETGVVKNFTIRNAEVNASQSSSFIAGVNRGTIENVVIDDTCKILVGYSKDRGIGYAADYNSGNIRNVVCHAQSYHYGSWDSQTFTPVNTELITATKDGSGTATNCYVGNTTDLSQTLGAGWTHIAGAGTYYGSDFGKVLDAPATVYVGQTFDVTVYNSTVIEEGGIEFLTDWLAAGEAPATVPGLEVKSSEGNVYTIGFASDVTSALFETVKMFRVGVRVGGENGKYIDSFYVTVGAPYITEITEISTQDITCIQDSALDLNTIDLTVTMSDGTTRTVHPSSVTGLDTATTGEQNVTFVYAVEGGEDLTINGTVTVNASTGAITVSLKSSVDKVVIPYNATDGWALKNVDWSQYITASVTGFTVTANKTSGEQVTLTVSKGAMTPATVTVDVYYGIADKAAFRAMANDLAGWYIVTDNFAFDGEEDSWAPLGAADSAPFTGVLDGNYKKISNMFIKTTGWGAGIVVQNGGTIKNVVLINAISNGTSAVGTIAGVNRGGRIENCFVQATVVYGTVNGAGGIVYANDVSANSVVQGCVFIGKVQRDAAWAVGGVVGNVALGNVSNNVFMYTDITSNNLLAQTAIGYADEYTGDTRPSNNATIAADKLTFNADDTKYYSSDDTTTEYTNALTSEITALVKEYLRGQSE